MSSKSETENTMDDMKIFNSIQNFIRKKINNIDHEFFGEDYRTQWKEVYELIKQSVETHESNSAIICGPPGCGKTALLNNVIKTLKSENIITEETAKIISLNGLLHTDDRTALKDITRQMNVEENIEAKTFSSFQENLVYLVEKLKEQTRETEIKPCIIFILDEFHLFCEHRNQILLYNLFDIVQSAKDPICVVGLTYYTDVMDLLEKRVLSRFSHRIILMIQTITPEERLKLFKNIFTLDSKDLPNVEEIYKVVWNTRTEELAENKEVYEVFKHHLDLNTSQASFRNLLFKLFNTITFELPLLTVENVKSVFTPKDPNIVTLSRLSLLETALVIAVKHQTVNYEREPFNFEMIYTQFLKFMKRNASNLVKERPIVFKAFQRLQELEFIKPLRKSVGNSTGKVQLDYQLYNFTLTEDQVNEGIKSSKELTAELKQWALSSD